MLPATTWPECRPMPVRISGRPRCLKASLIVEQARTHLERGFDGVERIVRFRHRRAEHRHDRVADELVDHAMMGEDALDHAAEVLVQEVEQRARVHALADAGEGADVGEQHRHRHELAAQVDVALHQVVGDLPRDVATERFPQPVALLEAAHHLVEVQRESLELVAAADHRRAHVLARFTWSAASEIACTESAEARRKTKREPEHQRAWPRALPRWMRSARRFSVLHLGDVARCGQLDHELRALQRLGLEGLHREHLLALALDDRLLALCLQLRRRVVRGRRDQLAVHADRQVGAELAFEMLEIAARDRA